MRVSIENKEKAELLLKQLALDEKIGMIHGDGLFHTKGVERLGIPPLYMSDGPMGVRAEWENDAWIPIGHSQDACSYLPSNSAIAATWNKELAYECGSVLGEEARGRGKDIILAPGINIKRSPLNGRNFEYMSEDPYLTAKQCVEVIKGIQEHDVAACVKHFAMNSQETQRLWVDVEVEERALREIYLPAFRAAVDEGNSFSLMGAYNLIRGQHCCESRMLLNEVLREEWGYEGLVVSDWGAVHKTKAAAESGLDVEMSVTSNFDEYFMAQPLKKAVEDGEISEELVDAKIRHILWLMLELHMFDVDKKEEKTVKCGRKSGCYNTPEHREKTLDAARESIILLKNENNMLPLKKEKIDKLLLIGVNADRMHSNGGGSAEIKALYEITPYMGLSNQLGGNCEIKYIEGYFEEKKIQNEENWQESSLEADGGRKRTGDAESEAALKKRKALLEEAVKYAEEYEHVIFVGGLNHEYDVEGQDRSDMKLPYGQDAVLEAVLSVNPNTIVVMIAGSPIEMSRWENKAKAIVFSFYAGMEGGSALAEVLLGEVNPSGKLPESFPYIYEDCSAHKIGDFAKKDLLHYKEGIYVGYRYYEKNKIPVQYCFGHGLSYTEFVYGNMKAWKKTDGPDWRVEVSCDVGNAGKRKGKEIVQLYIKDKTNKVDKPVKELKSYEKIELEAGETGRVSFCLREEDFSYYDESAQNFKTISGNYELIIAASIMDERLREEIELSFS